MFLMCTVNSTEAGKPRHINNKADLVSKCVLCNELQVLGTNVGCGPAG